MVVSDQLSYIVRYYRSIEPPFVFLSDRVNLQSIYEAGVLVMDGTFDYCPNNFYQTYTVRQMFSECFK